MHKDIVAAVWRYAYLFPWHRAHHNNDPSLHWADKAGYKAILSEGWDPVLGWRSPNFVLPSGAH